NIGQYLIDPNVVGFPMVAPFDSAASARSTLGFQLGPSPFSVPIDITATYTRMVSPGDVFDVGYELTASTVEGAVDLSHTAGISIDLPAGYSVTSVLGFGAGPNGGVPEPSTWAMLLFGVGALGAAARRRRAPAL